MKSITWMFIMCFGCVIRNLHNQFSEPVIKKFRVFLQNSLENLSFWGPVFTYFFEKQSLRLTSVFKSSQPLVPVLHRSIPPSKRNRMPWHVARSEASTRRRRPFTVGLSIACPASNFIIVSRSENSTNSM